MYRLCKAQWEFLDSNQLMTEMDCLCNTWIVISTFLDYIHYEMVLIKYLKGSIFGFD